MVKITEFTHYLLKYMEVRGEAVQCWASPLPHIVNEAGGWHVSIGVCLYIANILNYGDVPQSVQYI